MTKDQKGKLDAAIGELQKSVATVHEQTREIVKSSMPHRKIDRVEALLFIAKEATEDALATLQEVVPVDSVVMPTKVRIE